MKKFLLVFSMMVFVGSMAIAQTTAPAAGAKAEKASTEKVKAQDAKAKTECTKDSKGAACCSDKSAAKTDGKSCSKSCCDKSKADGKDGAMKAKETAKTADSTERKTRANGGAVAAKKE